MNAADTKRVAKLMTHFAFEHLPPALREISRPFCELAEQIVDRLAATDDVDQLIGALENVLAGKDCAVRAARSLPVAVARGDKLTAADMTAVRLDSWAADKFAKVVVGGEELRAAARRLGYDGSIEIDDDTLTAAEWRVDLIP